MPEVKRAYHAPHRQRQAQATRERIAAAARMLFARDGYAATTIQAVASQAGVATPTVYATFGSKRSLLLALLDAMEAEGGVEEWQAASAAAAGDPIRQVQEWVGFSRRFFERGADVLAIVRGAGTADPDLRELDRAGDDRRRAYARSHVRAWAALGALRPELDPDAAEDVVWTLLGPDVYRLLVQECGWSGERYEGWLVTELEGLLDPQWFSRKRRVGAEQPNGERL